MSQTLIAVVLLCMCCCRYNAALTKIRDRIDAKGVGAIANSFQVRFGTSLYM